MIGKTIMALRKEADMSREDLAKYLELGRTTINGYEHNIIVPPADKLIKIADKFNVSIDYLLGRTTIRNAEEYQMLKVDVEKMLLNLVEMLYSDMSIKYAGNSIDMKTRRIIGIHISAVLDILNILIKH